MLKLLDEMIDFCLFGQSLEDFKKAHNDLEEIAKQDLLELWAKAQRTATLLMCL